jgi:hypothetical protein
MPPPRRPISLLKPSRSQTGEGLLMDLFDLVSLWDLVIVGCAAADLAGADPVLLGCGVN